MTTRNILRLVILAGAIAYVAYAKLHHPESAAAKPETAAAIPTDAKEFKLGSR